LPESLLDRRLKLGTFLGIGLYVHWSFALVIVYVAISTRSLGAIGIAFSITQLLGVFLCVTLHEYGHAMAARRFGIATADITLLPIGGVARLRRMPRIPWQELVVAIAGPAVNVLIVILLVLGFFVFTDASVLRALISYFAYSLSGAEMNDAMVQTMIEVFTSPSLLGFAVLMLIVNIMLVVFNMIPAFPMDGGRVFRSLLAMKLEYRQATFIASRVGLACAALMAVYAMSADPPQLIPVLIAVFIAYAGISEARHVEVIESVRGLTAGQVMVRSEAALPLDMRLFEIIQRWQTVGMSALPVLSIAGTVVGMLRLDEVIAALEAGKDPATTAGQLIDHSTEVGTVQVDEDLESALLRTGKHRRQIPVVDVAGQLQGILDLDSMLIRGELSKRLASTDRFAATDRRVGSVSSERFDQTT
jgi:Zn-dependent protease